MAVSADEKAHALFNRGCTCGGIDIGVGEMHEPGCGLPTPDEVAAALAEAEERGSANIVAMIVSDLKRAGIDWNPLSKPVADLVNPILGRGREEANRDFALIVGALCRANSDRIVVRAADLVAVGGELVSTVDPTNGDRIFT